MDNNNENIRLLKRLRSNSKRIARKAFDEVYTQYGDVILLFCRKYTGNKYLADDIFQDTFIKFYEFVNKEKKAKIGDILPYLISISKNCYYNTIRHNHILEYKADVLEMNTNNINYSTFLESDEFEFHGKDINIDYFLNKLTDSHREVIILFFYMNYSYKTISKILSTDTNTISTRLYRAKKNLHKLMQDQLKKTANSRVEL